METSAEKLASLLRDKKIFHVIIEQPDGEGSTNDTSIEDPKGVSFFVDGDVITFKGENDKASFAILDDAQIITKNVHGTEVITSFAENGTVQVKSS